MFMKKIALSTKEELNIYMSPVRQQLLRLLSLANAPMTPKMLAGRLNISASSVQFHIKKLLSIGVIELDHTEKINGITASFYKPSQVTVQIGLDRDGGFGAQREVLAQDLIAQVYDGFRAKMKKRIELEGDRDPENLRKWGDILSGVVYLSNQESSELIKLINEYIERHSAPGAGKIPWEFAFIAYNAEESRND
jgi:DNA-binding transcriptional ArsR family regulator